MLINPDHLAFVLWRYKAAKELKQQSLCRLFSRLRHFLLRITLQAAGKPRNRLFIWIHECHQTEQQCYPMMPLFKTIDNNCRQEILHKRTYSLLFREGYFFSFQLGSHWQVRSQPALNIVVFIVIFLMAIRAIIVLCIRLRVTVRYFFRGYDSRKRWCKPSLKFAVSNCPAAGQLNGLNGRQ